MFWPSFRVWLGRIVIVAFVTGPVIIFLLERFNLYIRPQDSEIMKELAMVEGVFEGTEANQITWVKNDVNLVSAAKSGALTNILQKV